MGAISHYIFLEKETRNNLTSQKIIETIDNKIVICTEMCTTKQINNMYTHITRLNQLVK